LPASAQSRRTLWGVHGGFSPNWKVPNAFEFLFNADEIAIKGSEFRIGFVRGRIFEGDWGVSLIRKQFAEGSTSFLDVSPCDDTPCGTFYTTTSNTSLLGVEVHKFAPFGTIRQRVQIGISVGGGIASMRGTLTKLNRERVGTIDIHQTLEDVKASELFQPGGTKLKVVPIGRLELAVAGILGPGLKVRAGGGLNLPGYSSLSVEFLYLFGVQ
jgi:hypothetical protein